MFLFSLILSSWIETRRKIIKLYDKLANKLSEDDAGEFYLTREQNALLYPETATKEAILEFDEIVHPMYDKAFKKIVDQKLNR